MTVDALHHRCSDGRTRSALYPHLQALKGEGLDRGREYRRIRVPREETLALTAAGHEAHWSQVVEYLNGLPTPPRPMND